MNLIPRDNFFDIEHLFDRFAAFDGTKSGEGGLFAPRVDIREMDDHYQICAEMPGLKKEDIEVTVEDGVLTISAQTKSEQEEKKEGLVIRRERRCGSYMRSFTLAPDIDEKQVTGCFEDGLLTLTVPKSEEKASTSKRVEIR